MSNNDEMLDIVDQSIDLGQLTIECKKYMQKYNVPLGDFLESMAVLLKNKE
jgi:hypothetical protein